MPINRQKSCATLLKTLADATRLHVVCELLSGPQSVGELNLRLHLPQSLLSHHLSVLRNAGLVTGVRLGKAVRYQLAPGVHRDPDTQVLHLGCCALAFPRSPASNSAAAQ